MKEIQRAESKRVISMIAWYENSIANGLDFEEGSLVDMEDAYLADRVLTEVREGRMATYTLDEVERELGLAD